MQQQYPAVRARVPLTAHDHHRALRPLARSSVGTPAAAIQNDERLTAADRVDLIASQVVPEVEDGEDSSEPDDKPRVGLPGVSPGRRCSRQACLPACFPPCRGVRAGRPHPSRWNFRGAGDGPGGEAPV